MRPDKYTPYHHAFDPPEETDPRGDLLDFIEEKEQDLFRYSKRSDATEQFIKRRYKDISILQQIYDRLTNLNLYSLWVKLEKLIKVIRDQDYHGIRITIPFVKNANDGKFYDIDYRREL